MARLRANSRMTGHELISAVAALTFLRWADFQDAELEAMAAFDGTDYVPALPVSLHWRTWHQLPPEGIYQIITERLPEVLAGRFDNLLNPIAVHLNRLHGTLKTLSTLPLSGLADLVQWLAAQPFETPNDRRRFLDVYDDLLENFQDKNSGVFKTPKDIARLMVMLAAPSAGERVYDPCFGTAGLLTSALEYVLKQSESGKLRHGESKLNVSGVELNEFSYVIGMTRLILAGFDDPQLEMHDSLTRNPITSPQKNGFDVVLANPPWGWKAKMDNRYGLEHYPIMTSDSTGLFIQHTLLNLHHHGRAVIAVPHGILFKGGADQKLRQWLVQNHTVEAVIALPETALAPATAIKLCLLVLRRGGITRRVRMADAGPFFEKGKGQQPATLPEHQAKKLVEMIRDIQSSEFCWDVDGETLAEINFDLTPRRRDQSGLDKIVETLKPLVHVVRLKDCCQIMAGRPVRSADLIESQPGAINHSDLEHPNLFSNFQPIPYIRIKDIQKNEASKNSAWISPQAEFYPDIKWKLRAGDVLFSKSGTIGKVGVVRNGAIGAVAASGLYILRADFLQINPHYLAAYMSSDECKAWVNDRSSGSVIGHVNKQTIESIPVPLPPHHIQHRVAVAWSEHKVDVLKFLGELLIDAKRDPFADWVEKELKPLRDAQIAPNDPLDFPGLNALVKSAVDFYNEPELFKIENRERPLRLWFREFIGAILTLEGIHSIPPGPGLLIVLQEALKYLKKSESLIEEGSSKFSKARLLNNHVLSIVVRGLDALFKTVNLVFRPEPSALISGKVQDLDLWVINNGLLPLREIKIEADPDWGRGVIQYLGEKATDTIGLKVVAPETAEQITLTIFWSAFTLDGQKIKGIQEIAFEVAGETSEQETIRDFGPSPYVCGDPIRPERNDVFFGRDDLLDQIRRQVIKSGNVILLEGNRRAGKSSVLRHLEGADSVPGWLGVYCSLQGADGSQAGVGVPTATVFREIASCMAKSLATLNIDVPLPDGRVLPPGKKMGISKACRNGIGDQSPFADFRDYADELLDCAARHKLGILLMLDEFDKLQEGIDNGVTSPQVPENIRYMVQTYSNFSAILTGSRRLKRMREEYWSALYGLGTRFGVTSLAHDAASRLVTDPVKGRLAFSRESIERAISLTHGQPYLLQCLCNRIFDMTSQLKIRSVTLDLVEQAGDLLAENNEHFASLWDYARSDLRRFLLGLIHKETDGPNSLRFGVLQELLSSHGIEVRDETLITDLDFLRELELIDHVDETGSSHYKLSIPLMGRWIDRQHDFEVLKKKAQMETEDQHDG